MNYFTREQLRQDLELDIAAVLTRLDLILGPGAAGKLMRDVKYDGVAETSAGRSIDSLPITYQFMKIYDYVVNNEWDWFGGHHHAEDLYLDTAGFFRWVEVVEHHYTHPTEIDRLRFLVNATYARLKLDQLADFATEEALTLEDVALLADMNLASVRNAASRGEFRTVDDAGVRQVADKSEIRNWLTTRRSYRPTRVFDSIDNVSRLKFRSLDELRRFLEEQMLREGVSETTFKQAIGWSPDRFIGLGPLDPGDLQVFNVDEWIRIAKLLNLAEHWLVVRVLALFPFILDHNFKQALLWEHWEKQKAAAEENSILVPEAGDGTRFLPELRRRRGYLIGRKGDERYIDDYFRALEMLKAMDTPYWRRPAAETRIYGIVKGITLRPVPKRELERGVSALDGEV